MHFWIGLGVENFDRCRRPTGLRERGRDFAETIGRGDVLSDEGEQTPAPALVGAAQCDRAVQVGVGRRAKLTRGGCG